MRFALVLVLRAAVAVTVIAMICGCASKRRLARVEPAPAVEAPAVEAPAVAREPAPLVPVLPFECEDGT